MLITTIDKGIDNYFYGDIPRFKKFLKKCSKWELLLAIKYLAKRLPTHNHEIALGIFITYLYEEK